MSEVKSLPAHDAAASFLPQSNQNPAQHTSFKQETTDADLHSGMFSLNNIYSDAYNSADEYTVNSSLGASSPTDFVPINNNCISSDTSVHTNISLPPEQSHIIHAQPFNPGFHIHPNSFRNGVNLEAVGYSPASQVHLNRFSNSQDAEPSWYISSLPGHPNRSSNGRDPDPTAYNSFFQDQPNISSSGLDSRTTGYNPTFQVHPNISSNGQHLGSPGYNPTTHTHLNGSWVWIPNDSRAHVNVSNGVFSQFRKSPQKGQTIKSPFVQSHGYLSGVSHHQENSQSQWQIPGTTPRPPVQNASSSPNSRRRLTPSHSSINLHSDQCTPVSSDTNCSPKSLEMDNSIHHFSVPFNGNSPLNYNFIPKSTNELIKCEPFHSEDTKPLGYTQVASPSLRSLPLGINFNPESCMPPSLHPTSPVNTHNRLLPEGKTQAVTVRKKVVPVQAVGNSLQNKATKRRCFSEARLVVPCHLCNMKVCSTGHLKRHLQSHGARRRYPCPVCDCSYSRPDNLKKHIQQAHAGIVG